MEGSADKIKPLSLTTERISGNFAGRNLSDKQFTSIRPEYGVWDITSLQMMAQNIQLYREYLSHRTRNR